MIDPEELKNIKDREEWDLFVTVDGRTFGECEIVELNASDFSVGGNGTWEEICDALGVGTASHRLVLAVAAVGADTDEDTCTAPAKRCDKCGASL